MKIGLLARDQCRGLGIQSHEFYRAMKPERTLVVDMGELARGFASHPEWYPDAVTAPFDGHRFPDDAIARTVRPFLDGLDVLFTAETLYDWRLAGWAQDAGVAVVVQVNPEFHDPDRAGLPVHWAPPTDWRLDSLPTGAVVLPVPVALDRFPEPEPTNRDRPLRVLHVAGHRAAADRNGTNVVLQALRSIRCRVEVTVTGQDGRLPSARGARNVTVRNVPAGVQDYWDLYRGQDVLVQPRRFGGLHLPAQEAAAAGLALVMTGCEPNHGWPITAIPAVRRGSVGTPGGDIDLWNANPSRLAAIIDRFADDRDLLEAAQTQSRRWAETNSWERWRPRYLDRFRSLLDPAP